MSKQRCESCYEWKRDGDLEVRGNDLICAKCRRSRFYVLAVEPGEETRVVTNLKKAFRLGGLGHLLGKVVVPREFRAKLTKDKYAVYGRNGDGKVVHVEYDNPWEPTKPRLKGYVYHENADDALWEAKQRFGDEYDVSHVELEKAGGAKKVQRAVSYRGYVIVQMDATPDAVLAAQKVRGVWGLLPMKPTLTGVRYAKGEPPMKTKPKKWEQEKHEEWSPTPLDSEEAAMLLIQTEGLKLPPPDLKPAFQVGDRVRVGGGGFKGASGRVTEVAGDQVKVEFEVIGRKAAGAFSADYLVKE